MKHTSNYSNLSSVLVAFGHENINFPSLLFRILFQPSAETKLTICSTVSQRNAAGNLRCEAAEPFFTALFTAVLIGHKPTLRRLSVVFWFRQVCTCFINVLKMLKLNSSLYCTSSLRIIKYSQICHRINQVHIDLSNIC